MNITNKKIPAKTRAAACLLIVLALLMLCGCGNGKIKSEIDYSDRGMWAFLENDNTKKADVFLIAPTVYYGDEASFNMPINDEKNRSRIVGALNMQVGIFNEVLNVYAPYYCQASISAVESNCFEEAIDIAYADISAAFCYYMKHLNNGQAFVLSGFSQGAELCVRLMQDYPGYLDNMIACYIYGYAVTEDVLSAYPQIRGATREDDIGVVICFNSEAEEVNDTFTVPNGTKSICINPLNWKTDITKADKTLNKGACFLDYKGNISSELDEFTGAYIDEKRGTLKLPDVNPEEYKSNMSFLKDGEYHLYEYEFFYRNLQENVKLRLQKWNEKNS